MSSALDELRFYGTLAATLLGPRYDLGRVPGPPGHPLLGNITAVMRPDYHVQMLEWANTYGGIFKFSLGFQPVVVVSDPAVAVQVLGRAPGRAIPRKCVGYKFFDLATNASGAHSFFTTSDEGQWAAVRKAAAAAFSSANVKKAFPIALRHLLLLSLLHVFVEALFGVTPEDFPGRQVAADMNLVLEEANSRLKVPLSGLARAVTQPVVGWREGGTGHVSRGFGARNSRAWGSGEKEWTEENWEPRAVTDLWACLGRVRHPRTGELLGRQGLVPEIGALMMAGFDTSSHSVAWALFALAANPEAQQRVRQELDGRGLLRRPGTAAPPRLPVLDDLPQLPYLNACIDEAMRMYPVAATASVREVTEPTRVGDFVIPPGVIVWPMLYALHNSVHNWDQPDVFKPERWLQSNAGGSSSKGGGGGKRYMPFSDGMKSCLGQALGLMEVRTALVVLLGRYAFALDPGHGGEAAVRRSMIMSLTLKIRGGLRLVATPLG
eukprot:XP_001703398.1 cytochrome P450 [Chlamydomonas reinhardtii]